MLCDHGLIAILLGHLSAALDEDRKQIALAVGVVLFHIVTELCAHAAAAHIRRVRHYHVVLLGQSLGGADERQQGEGILPLHGDLVIDLAKAGIEGVPVLPGASQDGAVFLGVAQLAQDGLHGKAQPGVSLAEVVHGFPVGVVALRNGNHVGLQAPAEEAPVVLPGLHHDGEIAELGRPLIDVQAPEVMLHDGGRRLPGGIAVVLIDLHQHVEEIDQDVPAAAAGVDDPQLLRRHGGVALPNLRKLGLHLRLLLRLLQIVVPPALFHADGAVLLMLGQELLLGGGMSLYPQTAQGIFHHIAHDPVRREKLGGGGDLLLRNLDVLLQIREDLVLRLGVVVLIEPPDDLHLVRPVLLRDGGDHLLDHAARAQEVIRKQQLGIVLDPREHARQHGTEGVALRDEKVFIKLFGAVCFLQAVDLVPVQTVQLQMDRLGQNLRLERAGFIGKNANMRRQDAVDLHVEGAEAVEPGIGRFLHCLLEAVPPDLADQLAALLDLTRGKQPAVHLLGVRVAGLGLGNAVLQRFLLYACQQFISRPDRKFLDCVFIHNALPFSSTSASRSPPAEP